MHLPSRVSSPMRFASLIALVVALVLLFLSAFPLNTSSGESSGDPVDDWNPNLPVNQVIKLTNGIEREHHPVVWDKKIAWQKDELGEVDYVARYIVFRDLEKETTMEWPSPSNWTPHLRVGDGTRVGWGGLTDSGHRVHIKDIETGEVRVIPAIHESQRTSDAPWSLIDDQLVFNEHRPDGTRHLYLMDLTTDEVQEIATSPYAGYGPVVAHRYADRLVYEWLSFPSGSWDIVLRDLGTENETTINDTRYTKTGLRIWGDRVMWAQEEPYGNYVLYLKDLGTGWEGHVDIPEANELDRPPWWPATDYGFDQGLWGSDLSGDIAVWQEQRWREVRDGGPYHLLRAKNLEYGVEKDLVVQENQWLMGGVSIGKIAIDEYMAAWSAHNLGSNSFDVYMSRITPDYSTSMKTSTVARACPGAEFSYIIEAKNDGIVADPNLVVVDTLPEGVTYVGSNYTPEISGRELSYTLGPVAPGESKTIEIRVVSNSPAGTGLTNYATIDPTKAYRKDLSAAVSMSTPDYINSSKAADQAEVFQDEWFTYTVHVENSSCIADEDVVVKDNLPADVGYLSSNFQAEQNGQELTYRLGRLGPGESRDITIEAIAWAPPGTVLENHATIDPDQAWRRDLVYAGPTIVAEELPPTTPDPEVEAERLRRGLKVVSYNICNNPGSGYSVCNPMTDARAYDIADYLKTTNAHVIGLNEVNGHVAGIIADKLKGHGYKYLRFSTNKPWRKRPYCEAITKTCKLPPDRSDYGGNMLLSKYPIRLGSTNVPLGTGGGAPGVLVARIQAKANDFYFFVSHLTPKNESANFQQSVRLKNYIESIKKKHKKPIILAADMNSGPKPASTRLAFYCLRGISGINLDCDDYILGYSTIHRHTWQRDPNGQPEDIRKYTHIDSGFWLDHTFFSRGNPTRQRSDVSFPRWPGGQTRWTLSDHLPLHTKFLLYSPKRKTIKSAELQVGHGETLTQNVNVSSQDTLTPTTFSIEWPGSDLELTLVKPDGTIIDGSTTDPDIYHEKGLDYEAFEIGNAEPGTWQIQIEAVDVPPEGEPVDVGVFSSLAETDPVDDIPPSTTLELNPATPDGTDGWYTLPPYVFLTATDDHPGSYGLDATYHWLHDELEYEGEKRYEAPFTLQDGEHELYYHSRDNSANIEEAKKEDIKVDATAPTPPVLSATLSSPTQIDLSWTASEDLTSGVAGYEIYEGDSDLPIGSTTETSYALTEISPGLTYDLYVKARDNAGNYSEPSNIVTIQTNQPPLADAGGPYVQDEGLPVSFDASASTDPDGDTLQYRWDFEDDGTWDTELSDSPSAAHTWNDDYTGTVGLEVSDGTVESQETAAVTINNAVPLVDAGPDKVVDEGEPIDFSGSFTDPGLLDTHTVEWDFGNSEFSVGSLTPTHVYRDDGVFTVTLTVTDNDGGVGQDTLQVEVINVDPEVGEVTVPVDPVAVDNTISASAPFTDEGILDTHTALWSWGDSSTSGGVVTEDTGSGTVSGSHAYTEAGVYTIELTVTDDDGGVGAATSQEYVVAYDPDGGFVTGGGWIDSPWGAYAADPDLTGKANFGFVSKYKRAAIVPTGETEFQFKVADLNFHSASYDWLVIAGARAQYKGDGTINGLGNYGFMLTAIDGALPGGLGEDKFRIKIWDKDLDDEIVYDNQMDADDFDDPITTTLGGGSIVIHKK